MPPAVLRYSFLAETDDFLTDLLFDKLVFEQGQTFKMNPYRKERRLKEEDYSTIKRVIASMRLGEKDLAETVKELCAVPYIKSFVRLQENEAPFQVHLRRYLDALMPESGVAFLETSRYGARPAKGLKPPPPPPPSSTTAASGSSSKIPLMSTASFRSIEVAVFTTRAFKKGETIDVKGGTQALTEEEDDALREAADKKDFSVIYTARKACFSLLLGPARFVNHDCRNNVEFYFEGKSMRFKCTTDIAANEEVFTHYGENYFEYGNVACLCATCEQLKRGHFQPAPTTTTGKSPSKKPKVPTAPSRSSSRHSFGGAAPSTSSSLSSSLARRPSLPAGSKKAKSMGSIRTLQEIEKRRSERTATPDQALTGKRQVHPPMAPPPWYAKFYEYQPAVVTKATGKVKAPARLRYIGPKVAGQWTANGAGSKKGKRKFADSSEEEDSSDEEDSDEDGDDEGTSSSSRQRRRRVKGRKKLGRPIDPNSKNQLRLLAARRASAPPVLPAQPRGPPRERNPVVDLKVIRMERKARRASMAVGGAGGLGGSTMDVDSSEDEEMEDQSTKKKKMEPILRVKTSGLRISTTTTTSAAASSSHRSSLSTTSTLRPPPPANSTRRKLRSSFGAASPSPMSSLSLTSASASQTATTISEMEAEGEETAASSVLSDPEPGTETEEEAEAAAAAQRRKEKGKGKAVEPDTSEEEDEEEQELMGPRSPPPEEEDDGSDDPLLLLPAPAPIAVATTTKVSTATITGAHEAQAATAVAAGEGSSSQPPSNPPNTSSSAIAPPNSNQQQQQQHRNGGSTSARPASAAASAPPPLRNGAPHKGDEDEDEEEGARRRAALLKGHALEGADEQSAKKKGSPAASVAGKKTAAGSAKERQGAPKAIELPAPPSSLRVMTVGEAVAAMTPRPLDPSSSSSAAAMAHLMAPGASLLPLGARPAMTPASVEAAEWLMMLQATKSASGSSNATPVASPQTLPTTQPAGTISPAPVLGAAAAPAAPAVKKASPAAVAVPVAASVAGPSSSTAAVAGTSASAASPQASASPAAEQRRKRARLVYQALPRNTRNQAPDTKSIRELVDSPENQKVAGRYPVSSYVKKSVEPSSDEEESEEEEQPLPKKRKNVSPEASVGAPSTEGKKVRLVEAPVDEPIKVAPSAERKARRSATVEDDVDRRQGRSSGRFLGVSTRALVDSEEVIRVAGGYKDMPFRDSPSSPPGSSSSESSMSPEPEPKKKAKVTSASPGPSKLAVHTKTLPSDPMTYPLASKPKPTQRNRTPSPPLSSSSRARADQVGSRSPATRGASRSPSPLRKAVLMGSKASSSAVGRSASPVVPLQKLFAADGARLSRSAGPLPNLRDIVDSPHARAVAGGFDEEGDRYVSNKAGKRAQL